MSLDPDGVKVEVGDQVLVAGQKQGIVRFFGKTDFAPGMSVVIFETNSTISVDLSVNMCLCVYVCVIRVLVWCGVRTAHWET